MIFISFATIKGADYQDARDGIIMAINEAYSEHRYLLEWNGLTEGERRCFEELDNYAKNPGMKEPGQMIQSAMQLRICPIVCIVIMRRKF